MDLEEVQQAAVELFARKGYAATGIRELARELGLTSATLYHYAGGKEELLVAVMRACLDELHRAAVAAVQAADDPDLQLARLIHAHVGLCALNPKTARVTDQEIRALSPANHAVLVAIRDQYDAIFAHVIKTGARAGGFDVPDQYVARLALLEMCNGVANWYRPNGRLSVAEVQDRFVELGCRLVRTEPVTRAELGELREPARLACEPTRVAHPQAHPQAQEAV